MPFTIDISTSTYSNTPCLYNADTSCVLQSAQKELAKLRETEDKIRRAKEAQERRDREKKEKVARKKALVDITAGQSELCLLDRQPVYWFRRYMHTFTCSSIVCFMDLCGYKFRCMM